MSPTGRPNRLWTPSPPFASGTGGSATPISSGAGTEWSPAWGVSWHVVQVPTIGTLKLRGPPKSSLIPETAAIGIASVLKRSSPRATAARAPSGKRVQAEYSVKTIGLKLGLLPVHVAAVGSHPSGSLPPNVNVRSESISG